MIRFSFNEKKAAQAAGVILRRHGGSFDYFSLIKLLYRADRTALIETGMPITGDRMVAMEHGPVLSQVKNCLNQFQGCGRVWGQFISFRDELNCVRVLTDEETTDSLSDYEVEVLVRVDKEHGNKPKWMGLRKESHDLPEYVELHPGPGQVEDIRPETILRHAGVSPEEINRIAAEAAALRRLADDGAILT